MHVHDLPLITCRAVNQAYEFFAPKDHVIGVQTVIQPKRLRVCELRMIPRVTERRVSSNCIGS